MVVTTQQIQNAANQLREQFSGHFPKTPVDLFGGGAVEVKLTVRDRRGSENNLTGGATQDDVKCTIDAVDWDAVVGREPNRGDIITWAGRRYAIQETYRIAPVGQMVFYKCRVSG